MNILCLNTVALMEKMDDLCSILPSYFPVNDNSMVLQQTYCVFLGSNSTAKLSVIIDLKIYIKSFSANNSTCFFGFFYLIA